jgi:hypothetical protein
MAAITHPDYATLVDPLFATRKEGVKKIFLTLFAACGREGGRAQLRPGE